MVNFNSSSLPVRSAKYQTAKYQKQNTPKPPTNMANYQETKLGIKRCVMEILQWRGRWHNLGLTTVFHLPLNIPVYIYIRIYKKHLCRRSAGSLTCGCEAAVPLMSGSWDLEVSSEDTAALLHCPAAYTCLPVTLAPQKTVMVRNIKMNHVSYCH